MHLPKCFAALCLLSSIKRIITTTTISTTTKPRPRLPVPLPPQLQHGYLLLLVETYLLAPRSHFRPSFWQSWGCLSPSLGPKEALIIGPIGMGSVDRCDSLNSKDSEEFGVVTKSDSLQSDATAVGLGIEKVESLCSLDSLPTTLDPELIQGVPLSALSAADWEIFCFDRAESSFV